MTYALTVYQNDNRQGGYGLDLYNIYRKRKRLALVLKHNFHCCGEARRLIAGRKVSFRNRKWRKTQTDSFSAVKLLWGLPVITQRCVRLYKTQRHQHNGRKKKYGNICQSFVALTHRGKNKLGKKLNPITKTEMTLFFSTAFHKH